jgi:acetyl esterase/lipase
MRVPIPGVSRASVPGRWFSLASIVLILWTAAVRAQKPIDVETLKARMPQVFADFELVPDLVYKTVGEQNLQLDLLIPKNLSKTPAPLLICIHGGGWAAGNRYTIQRPDHVDIIKRCGKAGIISATIEYRLTAGKSTVFDSVVDCRDALRFLVKHAKQYGIDATRIATFGGSAGGHLSLMTALGNPKDFPGDPALAAYDPPSLRCDLSFYPLTDLTDRVLSERFLKPTRAALIFGGTFEEKTDLARLLSPVHLIRKTSTPVYLFHGDADTTLDIEHSRRLFQKGKEVGADIQFTEVKGGVHSFGTQCTPSIAQISEMGAQYLIERLTR